MSEKDFFNHQADLNRFRDDVVNQSRQKYSKIAEANLSEVESIAGEALNLVAKFEEVAKNRFRNIYTDTDIVWVISAPGNYSQSGEFPLNKGEDRYQTDWSKEMYRHRLRVGCSLVYEITARRLGKDIREVTKEDVKNHGPWLLYNPAPEDKEQFETVLGQASVRIPPEKTFVYCYVKEDDGSESPMHNTSDQVRSLHFPEGVDPRRVLVVSHAPHLARISYIMDKYLNPNERVFQAFPIKTPKGGEEYKKMEIEAILRYHYDFGKAGNKPYPFEF